MGKQHVSLRDVVRLTRAANELCELASIPSARRKHALEALTLVLDAQVGIMCDGEGFVAGGPMRYTSSVEAGWLGDRERGVYLSYLHDDHAADPCVVPLVRRGGEIVTVRREQLLADREWYGTSHVNDYRRGAGVDEVIYSVWRPPRPGAATQVIGIHRPWGDRRRFTERDRVLLHLFHRAAATRLSAEYLLPPAEKRAQSLPPRLRRALDRLLTGDSEKQVATVLGVTRQTLHGYVKMIYEHFGVSSRAELLALWIDRPSAVTRGIEARQDAR